MQLTWLKEKEGGSDRGGLVNHGDVHPSQAQRSSVRSFTGQRPELTDPGWSTLSHPRGLGSASMHGGTTGGSRSWRNPTGTAEAAAAEAAAEDVAAASFGAVAASCLMKLPPVRICCSSLTLRCAIDGRDAG